MKQLIFPAGGVAIAAGVAGPVFVVATLAAFYVGGIPHATPIDPDTLAMMLAGILFAMPIGFMIAIFPCLVGAAWMLALSRHGEMAQTPTAWAFAGAVLPPLAITPFGFDIEFSALAGLAITGGACGLICRRFAESAEA